MVQLNTRRGSPTSRSVLDDYMRKNSAANVPLRGELQVSGGNRRHQIVQNLVGDCLVKRAFIPIRPEVELEALEFDAELVGNAIDRHGREIRLPSEGAQTGEFRDLKVNEVVAPWRRILEGVERFAWRGRHSFRWQYALQSRLL